MKPKLTIPVGVLTLFLIAQADSAGNAFRAGNGGSETPAASSGVAPSIHAPGAIPGSAGERPPPTGPLPAAYPDDGPVDLEEKLGPVAVGALAAVMLAGLGALVWTGHLPDLWDADADTTYGLRPER